MLNFVNERHFVARVLVFDRLQDVGRDHSSVGRLEGGFHGVAIGIALWGSWRVVTIETARLSNHAVGLNVIKRNERSPKRGLRRAQSRRGRQEGKK